MTRLQGARIALTGRIDGVTRKDFKALLAEHGAVYASSISEDVRLLVVGEQPLETRVTQARELDIEVVDYAGFQRFLSNDVIHADGEVPLAVEEAEDAPPATAALDGAVRILDIAIPVVPEGPLTPRLSLFTHYTLDARTLEMLRFIARAVVLRQPCLLEGDTATSKTSAIQYLAALTGHEVVRINLNGQSDTTELVGRYIPNEEYRVPAEELMEHLDLLEEESQRILKEAAAAGRALSAVEEQQITANERIQPPAWRFHEGLVPQAMRKGWWVILDEVNLAEPAVLERLNSVLERNPSLVLTEGTGTRFGPGGDVEVHPGFRVFATMNPAEYQGRSVLSPAYKDRWVSTWQAQSPGELEYRQMLERMVFGRQPDVLIGNLRYAGAQDATEAPYASLSQVAGLSELLSRLAALHAGLVRMATPSEGKGAALGASRRERYVFSRRGLIAVLDALHEQRLCDPATGAALDFTTAPEAIAIDALERTYVDRIRGSEDRARVNSTLESLGLTRSNWSVKLGDAVSG